MSPCVIASGFRWVPNGGRGTFVRCAPLKNTHEIFIELRVPDTLSIVSSVTEKINDDGRSTRWDEHRSARRQELAVAARKAVHLYGTDLSMDDIATYAGTSKSIVYRYFVDKSGLQRAVSEAVMQDIRETLREAVTTAPTPLQSVRAMVATYLEMIEHSPNVYHFVTRGASALPFLDEMIEVAAIPYAREHDTSPAAASAWAAGAVGFVQGTGEWWLANGDAPVSPSRTEMTESITAWLWNGPAVATQRSEP